MTAVAAPPPLAAARRAPVPALAAGALLLALSAPLVKLADTGPVLAALARCALAVPVLWLLARRTTSPATTARQDAATAGAGACFAVDLVLWHAGIADIGAGLATVLGNLQVAGVALLAWVIRRERPSPVLVRAAPLLVLGVLLVAGIGSTAAYGSHPVRGALLCLGSAAAYSGFLLLLRESAGTSSSARALLVATSSAAVVLLPTALVVEGTVLPAAHALPWLLLLALSSQVVAWLLIAGALPHLPAGEGALLLLLQPVGALVVSAALLAERPTPLQVGGAAVVATTVAVVTARARRAAT